MSKAYAFFVSFYVSGSNEWGGFGNSIVHMPTENLETELDIKLLEKSIKFKNKFPFDSTSVVLISYQRVPASDLDEAEAKPVSGLQVVR